MPPNRIGIIELGRDSPELEILDLFKAAKYIPTTTSITVDSHLQAGKAAETIIELCVESSREIYCRKVPKRYGFQRFCIGGAGAYYGGLLALTRTVCY